VLQKWSVLRLQFKQFKQFKLNTNAYTHRNAYGDSHTNPDTHGNSHAYSDTYGNSNGNSHANSDTYGNAHRHTNRHTFFKQQFGHLHMRSFKRSDSER
jgi:hypothetical protein